MKSIQYVIKDSLGIHARPAAELVKLNSQIASDVKIISNKGEANGKSLLSIMKLAVKNGDKIFVEISGDDETDAIKKVEEFLNANL
jgi:phosphocarrier protein